MSDRKHWPELSIENVGPGPFEDDREVFLCSIAISLKRIADVQACPLVELPLRNGGVTHIRPSQVASVSVHVRYGAQGVSFVQMIGDAGDVGFTVALTVAETMERLGR